MDYLKFIEATEDMSPQQRSEYFNHLGQNDRDHLIDQAGDIELISLHARMVTGAKKIEKERNEFKRQKMFKVYDALSEDYAKALKSR